MDVDEAAAELYALPLAEFVPRRTALAKEIRAAGDRETAAAVAKLRKPTVAAWAVNQLARRHADRIEALLDAAEAARAAQHRAVSGRATALREATRDFRSVVDELVRAVGRILDEEGSGATHLTEVSDTLLAAGTDEVVAERLRAGTFERPADAPGWGTLTGMTLVREDDDAGAADAEAPAPAEEEVDERRLELASRRTELRRELKRLRDEETRVSASLERQERRAAAADEDVAKLEAKLAAARADAADEHERVAELSGELGDLRRTVGAHTDELAAVDAELADT